MLLRANNLISHVMNSCVHGLKNIASTELTFTKAIQCARHLPNLDIIPLWILTATLWFRLSPWFYWWENWALSKLPPKVTREGSGWAGIWTKDWGQGPSAPSPPLPQLQKFMASFTFLSEHASSPWRFLQTLLCNTFLFLGSASSAPMHADEDPWGSLCFARVITLLTSSMTFFLQGEGGEVKSSVWESRLFLLHCESFILYQVILRQICT